MLFTWELLLNPVNAGLYSLIFGSFLTACIYRIPYGRPKGLASLEADEEILAEELKNSDKPKINILYPKRSFCPECNQQLKWYHNIPMFSWLFLRGKCAFCKTKIPFRYPFVEFLSLASGLACYYSFDGWTAFVMYLFCCSLIVISFIDIDYYIIPNVISYPGMVVGFLLAVINQFTGIFDLPLAPNITVSLLGLLLGGGFLFAVSELYFRIRKRVGLGFGDVKLMAMVGLFFGPFHVYQSIILGSFAGAIIGVAQIVFFKKGSSHPLPFGPYLAIGTIVSVFTKFDFLQFFNGIVAKLMGL